jgi:hypothetical protein
MCDYSLMHVKSREARIGDTLRVTNFGTGTRGFCSPEERGVAVCLLPGTEIAFKESISYQGQRSVVPYLTAVFRQVNKQQSHTHHDALEFPDGSFLLLTFLLEGQEAEVLQMPKRSTTIAQAQAQKRVEFIA